MYLPLAFREERAEVLAALIAAHPLGLLIRHGASGLAVDPLPFLLHGPAGAGGRLVAHVARANPIVTELGAGEEVVIAFCGPQAYVSPSWYPSKAEGGRAVPTWNYVVVEVRGRARLVDDPAFGREVVEGLTARHEAGMAHPWGLDDAPEPHVAAQLRAIVGLEIEIGAVVGKWKASQNRSSADRDGVAAGLRARGGDEAVAMAELVAAGGAGAIGKIG